MRCPYCGGDVMIRGNLWECGHCGDSGVLAAEPLELEFTFELEERPKRSRQKQEEPEREEDYVDAIEKLKNAPDGFAYKHFLVLLKSIAPYRFENKTSEELQGFDLREFLEEYERENRGEMEAVLARIRYLAAPVHPGLRDYLRWSLPGSSQDLDSWF